MTASVKKQASDFDDKVTNLTWWSKIDCVYLLLGPISAAIHFIESQATTCSWVVVLFEAMVLDVTVWAANKYTLQIFSTETIGKVVHTMLERWHGTRWPGTGTVKKVGLQQDAYMMAWILDPHWTPRMEDLHKYTPWIEAAQRILAIHYTDKDEYEQAKSELHTVILFVLLLTTNLLIR